MIKINSKIEKWGNNLAICIPDLIAKNLGLVEGSEVEIITEGSKIIIKPLKPKQ